MLLALLLDGVESKLNIAAAPAFTGEIAASAMIRRRVNFLFMMK